MGAFAVLPSYLNLKVYMCRRLLDSRDSKVNTVTLHLIDNVTRNSPDRL